MLISARVGLTVVDVAIATDPASVKQFGQPANRRAYAIMLALTGNDGVAPARVPRGGPCKSALATDKVVPLSLQQEVAKWR